MKKLLIISVLVQCSIQILAQDFEGYSSVSLDFNQPVANTKLINTLSFGGIKMGYHWLINQKFSVGGELNWGTYKQYHNTGSFIQSDGSIMTTDYFNYVYAYGLTVNGRYYRSYDRKINPYGGVGLGYAYNKYTQYFNVYTNQNKVGGFLIRPEVGAIIRFSRLVKVCGLVALHYDYSTTASPEQGYADFSNYGINVGIVMLSW